DIEMTNAGNNAAHVQKALFVVQFQIDLIAEGMLWFPKAGFQQLRSCPEWLAPCKRWVGLERNTCVQRARVLAERTNHITLHAVEARFIGLLGFPPSHD